MIAEQLDGTPHRHHRRHRLPRHRAHRAAAAVRARLPARAADPPGPPLHRRAAGQAGDLRQQRLRPPPRGARHATASRQMVERPRHPDRRRRRHRRPRPRRRRARRAGVLRRRHPLRRHRVVRLAARRAPSRSTCSGPTRIVADAARPRRHAPPRRRCPPATSPATAAARRPRSPSTTARSSSTSTGAARCDGARRARADAEADSRRPDALVRFRKEARHELGAAGIPALAAKTEQRRSAWVKEQMVEAGRARAASLGWPDAYAYTKALGERALLQNRGDVPGVDRAAVDHRVGDPGAVPGLDPRLPHGRAGDHLLRPRAPEGVPRRARGHRRRDPRRPRGRRHHRRRRRPSRPSRAAPSPRWRPGSVNPLRYRHLVDMVQHVLHRAPDLRRRGPADHRPRVVVPRPRPRAAPARAGQGRHRARASACSRPSRSAGKQAAWAATLEEKREEVDRALAYVELYGAYAECEAIYGVDRLLARWAALDPEDQATFCFDPRVIDWDHYAPKVHLPVGRRALPGAHHAGRPHRREARGPAAPPGARPGPPLRRLRPREHAHRVERRGVVLVARHPPAAARGPRALRAPDAARRRRRCSPPTGATAATSSATSTAATRAPTSTQLEADAVEMFSDLILTKSFPAAIRRVREHRALGHRTVLITGALDFAIEPLRPLFDDIVAPVARPARRRHLPRRAHRRAAHRRGPRLGAVRLRRRPTASTSPRASPTPTPPPTSRCSRPSASRWP